MMYRVTLLLIALFFHHGPAILWAQDRAEAWEEYEVTDADREHWSFRPLRRPAQPEVKQRSWVRNQIDRFVLARMEQQGLGPLPAADRVTLIRRVSFDLIGLPPTPQEVDAFTQDTSPHAYESLVDRLLGCDHYGERWAQHWLDLARFAESDGFEHDKVRPDAWRYRDWVIDALNSDLPYDLFVHYQLAGDELFPEQQDARVATAFCLAGPDLPDINSQEERRHNLLNEMTSTVGAVLLGLQIGCAKCHDHKYDPVSQADFYRLRAIFEPAVYVQRNQSVNLLEERPGQAPPSHIMIRGDWRRKGAVVKPAFPRIANVGNDVISPPATASTTSGRRASLAMWLTQSDQPLTSRVAVNRLWQHHFSAGLSRTPNDFGLMGDVPSHPELLDWLATELIRQDWSLKRMHRLLVTSATYRQASRGEARSRQRQLHRDVSLARHEDAQETDPDNRLLVGFPRRRLEGEIIRDAMLSAANLLNTRKGGPGVRPPLPQELVSTLLKNQWTESPRKEDHYRRSIYIFARRNLRYPIFEAFDRPDASQTCARRSRSTTAPQSLLMFNSEFSLTLARRLASHVLRNARAHPDAWIPLAFRRTISRWPTLAERQTARTFLDQQQQLLESEGRSADQLALPRPFPAEIPAHAAAALTDLCLALLNANEFIYID